MHVRDRDRLAQIEPIARILPAVRLETPLRSIRQDAAVGLERGERADIAPRRDRDAREG
jgi:hypothetical protein